MWSFPHLWIAGIPVFQSLLDFVFCTGMIIPLVVMSCIPFLNVIRTRMMYIGWLFTLLPTQEQSASFASYMVTYDGVLRGNVGDGTPTYKLYGACMVGAMIAGFLNFFLGRGLFSTLGVVAQYQRRSLFDAADA
ncbi:hypothetical protein PI124_g9796 [Phytophthora idaei]|nr:hypothetical protein PI125_g8822 [Phytophthora idaei]KAG3157430.1 hypothetical protein PI126_g8332 [Phytophthora idaei]KAG3245457.1 hypothetical protein PI124_g9796 [Phytophthora idaei]